MTTPFEKLTPDAQTRQIEFATDLEQALASAEEDYAEKLGLARRVEKVKTKFPVPLAATGMKKIRGDIRYRTLSAKMIEAEVEEYFDGVSEKKTTLQDGEFMAWDGEPTRMAEEIARLPNDLVATALKNGDSGTHPWSGGAFFQNSNPFNPLKTSLGTFDNLHTGQAITLATLALIKSRFRSIKNATGKRSLGLKLTHILCHPDDEQAWLDIANLQFVGQSGVDAEENRHRGTFEVVVADNLDATLSGVYFPLALNKAGMFPWATNMYPSPEIRMHGEDSAMYEKELRYGVDVIARASAALILPHCIQRCAIA